MREKAYLSYVLVAFLDIFCSANNQLMNTVYLGFLTTVTQSLVTNKHSFRPPG